ncbi:MAG TPA: hypothetical protein VJZ76_23325 [Thermoanaerobaculia bacterium]|nr:hypothetical protein [Thermoanaerobaculia bacterium]
MRTPHFRIHYPSEYEAWATRAAAKIEAVRDAVVSEVGFAPPQTTDILIGNPRAESNGLTIALLDSPRIVLWTEPPQPDIGLGDFRDWIDLLSVHEMTHLVHLLRPSRNPTRRLIEKLLLPVNPITLSGPRWLLEGYATVIEGRITGSGRPNSAFRAAVLRKWAASGRMPSYAELAGNRRFLGMSMAYLAGSAYLEWLEERSGPGSLQKLWARMTARQPRSFEQSFEGVFGDRPERLYGQFVAELTAHASRAATEGELWQETSRASGEPAISPDGKQMAIVLRDEKRHATLVVWPLGANPDEAKYEERIAKILKRDPQDVAPVRAKPLPREPLHSFSPLDGGDVESPRWLGDSILFSHRQPDLFGDLHHDLFRWFPSDGHVERVTHLADVFDADPLPDGRHAIAVRSRFGFSQLVRVDVTNGSIEEVTKPSLDIIYSHPRGSAWAEHDRDGWHVVRDGVRVAEGHSPEWMGSELVYVRGDDLYRGDARITEMLGMAIDPAPAPDGSVYFMSLDPDGFVVRKIDGKQAFTPVPGRSIAALSINSEAAPSSHPYLLGRQEFATFFGGQYTAHERHSEIGLRMGDVVGRLDVLAIFGNGAALAAAYRGLPVELSAHLAHNSELRATWNGTFPLTDLTLSGGTLRDRRFVEGSLAAHQRDVAAERLSIAADSDRHARATLSARMKMFRVAATAGRNVALGGVATSVEPASLFIARILDPALPRDFDVARNYRGARAEVVSGPVALFAQHHHASRSVDLYGLEARLSRDPTPLVKAAGFDLTAGVARVRQERAVRGWLAIRWRP